MAELLSPQLAAAVASGVYAVQGTSARELHDNCQLLGFEDYFDLPEGADFRGESGAMFFKQESGFGYFAVGKPGTAYANDVLIATRGTLGSRLGPDWFSNYNIGVQLGPGNLPVHAGFNEVWKSFSKPLNTFFSAGRRPQRVHCVGHSLGGALATLNADFITSRGIAPVSLYTFGAPRTGDAVFARSLTRRVGAQFIHRVYHPSDPVPMIPLFPFWHMPFSSSGLTVTNTLGGLVNFDAHNMAESYLPAVQKLGDWGRMRASSAQRADDAAQAERWLNLSADGLAGGQMGSTLLLNMIGKALWWLVRQTGRLIANAIGGSLVAGVTVLDQLAWTLSQGASMSKEVCGHVKTLIGAIWTFLGRKTGQVVDVTVAFLRWVLELMFSSLRTLATRAMSLLG